MNEVVPTVAKSDLVRLRCIPNHYSPLQETSVVVLLVILQGELNSTYSCTWHMVTTMNNLRTSHPGIQCYSVLLKMQINITKIKILLRKYPHQESHWVTPIQGDYLGDYMHFFLCFALILQPKYGCTLSSAISWVGRGTIYRYPITSRKSIIIYSYPSEFKVLFLSINNHHTAVIKMQL